MTTLDRKNATDAYKWFLKKELRLRARGGFIKNPYKKDGSLEPICVSFLEFIRRYKCVSATQMSLLLVKKKMVV